MNGDQRVSNRGSDNRGGDRAGGNRSTDDNRGNRAGGEERSGGGESRSADGRGGDKRGGERGGAGRGGRREFRRGSGKDRHRQGRRGKGQGPGSGQGPGGQGRRGGREHGRSFRGQPKKRGALDRKRMDFIREIEKRYESQTAIDPDRKFNLETLSNEMTTRVIDLFAPIGRGQRAMIVAPPKTGKTILLQKIAHALAENEPDVRTICLLVDERPEEVTDFRRSVEAEVMASCSDQTIEEHVAVAEEAFLEARQTALQGKDVVILLDSLTRLARAFNQYTESSGKTLSGGLDSAAMIRPRKFFGSARNIDHGGSITVIATALIETGSRMDEIIFQEFKGTGNTEIVLSRKLAEQRIWPAIDLIASGTRREERLVPVDELRKIKMLRRALSAQSTFDSINLLLDKLEKTRTNEEFLQSIAI